jgi:hypothetical protein
MYMYISNHVLRNIQLGQRSTKSSQQSPNRVSNDTWHLCVFGNAHTFFYASRVALARAVEVICVQAPVFASWGGNVWRGFFQVEGGILEAAAVAAGGVTR